MRVSVNGVPLHYAARARVGADFEVRMEGPGSLDGAPPGEVVCTLAVVPRGLELSGPRVAAIRLWPASEPEEFSICAKGPVAYDVQCCEAGLTQEGEVDVTLLFVHAAGPPGWHVVKLRIALAR